MRISQLAKQEYANVKPLSEAFKIEVEKALSEIKHENVRLFLPENDMYRLLKLRVWMERYSVPLTYILKRLLPAWQQFVKKRTRRIKSEGLGVRVGTLTGKKSEEMLAQMIEQDYPSGENEIYRRVTRQEAIINKVFKERTSKNEIQTASDLSKTLFDFPDPKGYLQYYKRRMRKQVEITEDVSEEMNKRPFRNNPFL